jgi:transposase InsO family protein
MASSPDQLWFADFTYLRCWEGLVFFSFVIDAYSRRIVGWQFADAGARCAAHGSSSARIRR